MRRFLLLVFLSAFCCHGLIAQEYDTEPDDKPYRLGVGPKLGMGMSWGGYSDQLDLNYSSGLTYQFGAVLNAHLGRRYDLSDGGSGLFGFQLEALYGHRLIKAESSPLGEKCVEIPVLFQYYFLPTMAMEVGATFVHVLGCTPAVLDYQGAHISVGDIAGNDVMLSVGTVIKTSNGVMLGARINFGSSNLAGNFDTKVSTAMLSIAYLFTIVK